MVSLNFDATNVAPATGIDTVPAGWYAVAIDESDLKPTKDGAGTYLQLRFNILDGQYRGRKLFTRLNIVNQNEQARTIAIAQLSAIAHAVGILHVQDSQQLHGLPLKVRVKLKPAEGQYDESNEVTSFKNINEPTDGAAAPAAPAFGAPPAGFGQPPAAPAGFAPQPAAPAYGAPAAPAAPFAPPAPAFAPQPAPAAAAPPAQPWAAPPMAPAADPANPFGGQPPAQPWNGAAPPVQPAPAAAAQAQAPATPPLDPQAQAAVAAAQGATPPWAAPQS
jgi:hypothetical protein